jgi:hypothetical protein
VIECCPDVVSWVLKDAEPPEIVTVPNTVVPSRNCTVPVAVEGLTVAVKPTEAPGFEGFGDPASGAKAVVVVAFALTVSVRGADEALA